MCNFDLIQYNMNRLLCCDIVEDKANDADKEEADATNQFYDKKKSFFDNISCQSLDPEPVGRGHNADSRRLNSETFGNSVFRGGRGAGRGGRGYGSRPRDPGMYRPRDGGRSMYAGPAERGYGRRMSM